MTKLAWIGANTASAGGCVTVSTSRLTTSFPSSCLQWALSTATLPLERGYLGSIPARFMIGTMSFAQTAIASVLSQDMGDPARVLQASMAWNKVLMLQLDVLLAGYVTETPMPPSAPPPSDEPPADTPADGEPPEGIRRVLTNILDGNRDNGSSQTN